MGLQVLPPGVTSLASRSTPSFNAPLVSAPPSSNTSAYADVFAGKALAQDPRSLINPSDYYALRVWTKALLGNSWRDDITIDDLMKQNPRILYKAACLYLQARYWGVLPDDVIGPSAGGSPAYNWPNANSPLEQRIFTWSVRYSPRPVQQYLADDVNGAIYMPMLTPSMLIQKFDDSKSMWRVLNLGGTDRDFKLLTPGGTWEMRGWDFGEWYATNADFATVLKVIGFAVIAVAAAVTGGSALAAGAGLWGALGAAGAAAGTASQITNAVNGFVTACVNQNFGGALDGLVNVVGVTFGVNLRDVAVYQPGIDQIGQVIAPYTGALINLGKDTGGELLHTINQVGLDAKTFAESTKKF